MRRVGAISGIRSARIRFRFDKIGDENPVFDVRIQNPGSQAGLSGSLLAGELVPGVADDLRTQDFEEVGIILDDDIEGKGGTEAAREGRMSSYSPTPKAAWRARVTAGCFKVGDHGGSLGGGQFISSAAREWDSHTKKTIVDLPAGLARTMAKLSLGWHIRRPHQWGGTIYRAIYGLI